MCGVLVADLDASVDTDPRLDGPRPSASNGDDVLTSDKKRDIVINKAEEKSLVDKHASGQLKTLKVDYLKAACEHFRLPKSGRKDELIGRLEPTLDRLLARRAATQG